MTEPELDSFIDQFLRASLKQALKQVLVQNQPFAIITGIGKIPLANGQSWDLDLLLCMEPVAALVKPLLLQGFPASIQSQAKPGLKSGTTPVTPNTLVKRHLPIPEA